MNVTPSTDQDDFDPDVNTGFRVLDARHLTHDEFIKLGVAQIAYVKPVQVEGALAFAIHAADGTPMALAPDAAVAMAAIRQHDMAPALVH